MGETVKEVAKKLSIPKSTLRYYDKVDLLKPSREENGYRVYNESDLLMVKYILVMKYGEFSLEEMQTVLNAMQVDSTTVCIEKTEQLITAKKKLFQNKINYYQQMLALFEKIPEIKGFTSEEESEIDCYIEQIYQTIVEKGEINR